MAGWSVVADAFVPIDQAGFAHPTDHQIRIDEMPGRAIMSGMVIAHTDSGRPRIVVTASRSQVPARITHLLDLRASRQLTQAHLQRPDHPVGERDAELGVPSLVPGSPTSRPGLPVVSQRRLIRPDSRDERVVRKHLPQRMATMLGQQWLDLSSTGEDS
jgi:hypothetical protein